MDQQMAAMSFIFIGFGISSHAQFPLRQYHYINELKTWLDAQQYCRENYTDLATIESLDDLSRMKANFSYSWAWIGLRDDPNSWRGVMGNDPNSWRWSATGKTSETGFCVWLPGDPNDLHGIEMCVAMFGGPWIDVPCDSSKTFICYNVTEQNTKNYVYINIPETWSSAQSYCRQHYKDLAMIENEAEYTETTQIKLSQPTAWIGLYRVPWTWSDKSQSSFRNWSPNGIDNNNDNEYCASENTLHEWRDDRCDLTQVFICEQVLKRTTIIVKMTTVTDADLTDPEVNAQLLSQLGSLLSSHGWTNSKLQWQIPPSKKKELH